MFIAPTHIKGASHSINIWYLRHFSRPTDEGVSLALWSLKWQFDAKGRSLPWLALNFNIPTVQVYDLADD